MSYLERTAKKLLPILDEVKKRMIREKKKGKNVRSRGSILEKNAQNAQKIGKNKKNKVETLEINEEISLSGDENENDSLFSVNKEEEL